MTQFEDELLTTPETRLDDGGQSRIPRRTRGASGPKNCDFVPDPSRWATFGPIPRTYLCA